ncbi:MULTISPECIES: VOC family protein [Rhizobium]|uniref:VOC family protein n=1 Tax=Rhizobium TaxID=379 RepID=UPI001B318CF1|nr:MULTISPECIES: VOC family protein [Rhizobium]MBX4911062.1 glyoxalase/bleomycin resistance/dioxygenase family protein [Rhizobium bangladeshense]MBX5177181.1 glyoxalase/bleomycin resistance/dioxygenase family protein [Rhizobium lentis]MBX5253994.1 glyoxalase/bleomycin resistance/dioxygenase family protein [Rhizobium sp. NLR4b]MBX5260179.1 glyoxalase/bleomycin resistance/dioxygenase family protein [Rhizobium sp. NLR16b]MBX5266269.1 glyoxalase/bleomycin resistance/dioxygenase family protein [Rhi
MKVYGVEHFGFTVPNLEEAVEFFETVFGAVTALETGRVDADDEYMKRRLGVPGHCRIENIKVLRVGNGSNLEIFEYSGDDGDAVLKRNSQPGGFHMAFQVDDANAAAGRLRSRGIDVLDGPTFVESGPMAGLTWLYLRAPWGQFLEIVSMDGPIGYAKDGGPRLWSPLD